ncbi:MAG TPA: KH domain-containing protein [Candidatus Bathyarchaeia archaeon]|jgi:ribosomal RNA assembly protein|nr:KH domain-containing protein [Candidatus Bathyarchaeia archaeon]
MSFEQIIKIPEARIGVLIGKNGRVKEEIEQKCNVIIEIDSESGDARVSSGSSPLTKSEPFKAIEMISAISKGFSPERAYRLLTEDILQLIDIRDYAGKSANSIQRIKGRIIGKGGKSRKTIEELTGVNISVYGHTIGLIGSFEEIKIAMEAVSMISKGSSHKIVYNMLQAARRKAKLDKMKLWEENSQ